MFGMKIRECTCSSICYKCRADGKSYVIETDMIRRPDGERIASNIALYLCKKCAEEAIRSIVKSTEGLEETWLKLNGKETAIKERDENEVNLFEDV